MKKLFTLTLIALSTTVMAQTSQVDSGFLITAPLTYNPNKSDTTKCWFKEIVINKGNMDTLILDGKHNLNNAILEFWQHGYKVRFPYRGLTISGAGTITSEENEYYLYDDKKRVTNPVIAFVADSTAKARLKGGKK